MRAWLYDSLTSSEVLRDNMGGESATLTRVAARFSKDTINLDRPFLIYGLGQNTNEALAEDDDHEAHRQFFQIWIHDDGPSFLDIDNIYIPEVKRIFQGASHPPSNVTLVRWLETSAEFHNEVYNTVFRYIRFQAIISSGERLPS